MAVATGEEESLGLSLHRIRDLSMHPDGSRIAFTYERPTSEIWTMENLVANSVE